MESLAGVVFVVAWCALVRHWLRDPSTWRRGMILLAVGLGCVAASSATMVATTVVLSMEIGPAVVLAGLLCMAGVALGGWWFIRRETRVPGLIVLGAVFAGAVWIYIGSILDSGADAPEEVSVTFGSARLREMVRDPARKCVRVEGELFDCEVRT